MLKIVKIKFSDHCSKDENGNTIDIIPPAQQFLNKYKDIHINPPGISDDSNIELQKQSVCLKKCLSCGWKMKEIIVNVNGQMIV